jgi:hypothetical protein
LADEISLYKEALISTNNYSFKAKNFKSLEDNYKLLSNENLISLNEMQK